MYANSFEHIQKQILWYGFYERESILTWELLLDKEMTILDIGANSGYYSLIASPKVKEVYAFEPSSAIRESLEKNIALNHCENISTQPYALNDTSGQKEFYHSEADNSGMSGLSQPENFSGKSEIVETISLDEWMASRQLDNIRVIKIDVEGSEMKVLTGMKDTLSKQQPIVFIEIINEQLNKFGYNHADIYRFFSKYRYLPHEIIAPGILKLIHEPMESYNIIFMPSKYKLPKGITVR